MLAAYLGGLLIAAWAMWLLHRQAQAQTALQDRQVAALLERVQDLENRLEAGGDVTRYAQLTAVQQPPREPGPPPARRPAPGDNFGGIRPEFQ